VVVISGLTVKQHYKEIVLREMSYMSDKCLKRKKNSFAIKLFCWKNGARVLFSNRFRQSKLMNVSEISIGE